MVHGTSPTEITSNNNGQIEQLALVCAKSAVKSSAAVWKKFIGTIEAVQDFDNRPNFDDDPSDIDTIELINDDLYLESNPDNQNPEEQLNLTEDLQLLFDSPRTTDFYNTATLQINSDVDEMV